MRANVRSFRFECKQNLLLAHPHRSAGLRPEAQRHGQRAGRMRRAGFGGGPALVFQWQVDDLVREIPRFTRHAKELQIANALSDGDAPLVPVDHADKGQTLLLAPGGLDEKVLILGEQDTAESASTIKQLVIRQLFGAVLFCGQDIHAAEPKPIRDRLTNVVIHIERDAQGSFPKARMRFRKGEPASAFAFNSSIR